LCNEEDLLSFDKFFSTKTLSRKAVTPKPWNPNSWRFPKDPALLSELLNNEVLLVESVSPVLGEKKF
jgi:hypothetical protein